MSSPDTINVDMVLQLAKDLLSPSSQITSQEDEPTEPPLDKDNRIVEKINDTFTASAAYKDTAKIFPREIEMSRAGDKMAWVPGQMLGQADQQTKAPISVSKEFIHPGDHIDTRSSTSRVHQIIHERPPGVGAGWGEYDQFYEWQANGRTIDKDMVKPGNWENMKTDPLVFTDEDGNVEVVHYSDAHIEEIKSSTAGFVSLHTQLSNRDARNARQAAHRGHRNVRRSRGGSAGSETTGHW
ncbi:hypothetical protein DER45DRAFT_621956 [Fusarium avenaceum]|nr:hypothetical protein DER45DRAFT_621956 [Fusarium avenaceum]